MASLRGHRTPWLRGTCSSPSERGWEAPPSDCALISPPPALDPMRTGCTPCPCHWDGIDGGPSMGTLAGQAETGGLGVRGLLQIASGALPPPPPVLMGQEPCTDRPRHPFRTIHKKPRLRTIWAGQGEKARFWAGKRALRCERGQDRRKAVCPLPRNPRCSAPSPESPVFLKVVPPVVQLRMVHSAL